MQTSIRKIGNSRGIIIPAPMLASCRITEKVELEQQGDTLVIHRPRQPRAGWFDSYQSSDEDAAEAQAWESLDADEGDWEW